MNFGTYAQRTELINELSQICFECLDVDPASTYSLFTDKRRLVETEEDAQDLTAYWLFGTKAISEKLNNPNAPNPPAGFETSEVCLIAWIWRCSGMLIALGALSDEGFGDLRKRCLAS